MRYPEEVSISDSVITMKQIVDEVCPTTSENTNVSPYTQLLSHINPCSLPNEDYITAIIHIGIVEVDIKHEQRVLPMIAYIGIHTDRRKSWFTAVDQNRLEGNLIEESAIKAGFQRFNDGNWQYKANVASYSEKESLLVLIHFLSEEIKHFNASGVVLVTPRYDVTLALLISALQKYDLIKEFLEVVKGFGDMEMLSVNKQLHLKASGLKPFEDFYNGDICSFEDALNFKDFENIPRIMYMILEKLLSGKPSFQNFIKLYCRPSISPYSIKLLFNSLIPEIRENHHYISVINKVIQLDIKGNRSKTRATKKLEMPDLHVPETLEN